VGRVPNWTADSLATPVPLSPVPYRGDAALYIRAYSVLIVAEAAVVAVSPWLRIYFASMHGKATHWAGNFPSSAYHAVLVSFFAIAGTLLFRRISRQLEQRIAVSPMEEEVQFLDRMRRDLAVITQLLFFPALLLSVN
jgi:hypothetical protein